MSATAAKNAGVKWGCTSASASTGGVDISTALNKAAIDRIMALIDSTVFGSAGMSRNAALADASIDIGGFYASVLVTTSSSTSGFEIDAVAGTAQYVRFMPDTSASISSTNPCYGFKAVCDGFKGPEADPKGMLVFSAKMHMQDGVAVTRNTSGTW